jgi:hypothetical protein
MKTESGSFVSNLIYKALLKKLNHDPKTDIRWMLMLAVAGVGCQNNQLTSVPLEEELPLKMNTNRTLAADVSVNPYVNTSAYISSGFSFLNPAQVNKNRQAIGGNAYTEVYGFNIPEENRVRGIRWNTDDETTSIWRPQGIAGFTKDGVRYLLVSWYAKDDAEYKGSRITLIDISPGSRHLSHVQAYPVGTAGYSSQYYQLYTIWFLCSIEGTCRRNCVF